MVSILHALGMFAADMFKSRSQLEAENLLLRHQFAIDLRRAPPRLHPIAQSAPRVWIASDSGK